MAVINKTIYRIGFWSAAGVATWTILFGLTMLAGFIPGMSVSVIYGYLFSFFLTGFFLVMMVSIYFYAPDERKIVGFIGVLFAAIYAVLNSSVYYIQMTVVRTNSVQVSEETLRPFIFSPGTPVFALDMLGYGFLTLAMLFAAFVFTDGRLESWIRRLFIINGLFFVPTLIFPALVEFNTESGQMDIAGSAALLGWSLVFTPAIILVAILFKRLQKD